MDKMITRFPDQLREAIEIGRHITLNRLPKEIQQVYFAGMGGSGIGGDFVAEWVYNNCPVPAIVGKGYRIPHWINPQTTAVVSSYSGNTEETLEVYHSLKERGAHIIVVSSGGTLIELAKRDGIDFVKLPDDWSSPRACLGYSVVVQLYILHKLELIDKFFDPDLISAAESISMQSDEIRSIALKVAAQLQNKFTMIYTIEGMEPVGLRFRQQINENAKTRAAHFIIPEMNHNELVGWKEPDPHLAVLYFLSDFDSPRNRLRQLINKEIMEKLVSPVIELHAKGKSKIEQSLYLVHLGDWISLFLALNRKVDPVEVDVIDKLKAALLKA